MATEQDLIRELQNLFDALQPRQGVRMAKTGQGTGADTSDVDGEPGWVWVRYDSDQSKVSKVFSEIRGLPEDVPVKVGKAFPGDEFEQLLAINWSLYYQGLTNLVLDQYTNPAHGSSHGEAGADRAPIGLGNFEPGRVREMAPVSLLVWVETFRFTYGSVPTIWPGGSIDLTASVPAGVGHRYALVSLTTSTNVLQATDGDVSPLAVSPDLPATPIGDIPLAYVDLDQGDTTIVQSAIYPGQILWWAVGGVGDHKHSGAGDGGASIACLDELFVNDNPVVLDGGALTPAGLYNTLYVSGLYTDGAEELTWIYPDTAYDGECPQVLILRPGPFGMYDTYEITVRHGVGNIWLSSGQDVILDEQTDHLLLIYNGSYWCDLGGACCLSQPGIVAKTANYTITSNDYTVLVTCAIANITITLPPAANNTGREFNIKKLDATAFTVIADGNGGELIDGVATQTIIGENDSMHIQSDGTGWYIL